MVHSGLSRLGVLMQGIKNANELSATILKALQNVVGPNGTIVVPTFTYSLGNGEIYDPQITPCPLMGQFSEYFWRLPEAKRSLDPFLSVAAIGPRADELTKVVANTSFGKDSFFDRFTKIGGGVLNFLRSALNYGGQLYFTLTKKNLKYLIDIRNFLLAKYARITLSIKFHGFTMYVHILQTHILHLR